MIEYVFVLTTLIIGLFAGSLLTEGAILVPYWRRMEAVDFLRLHGSMGPKLFRYFAPLTSIAVLLGVATSILNQGQVLAWVGTAILCLLTLAIFFIYFKSANEKFAHKTITADELPHELSRWAMWHWIRTVLMIIAFGLSILGHI